MQSIVLDFETYYDSEYSLSKMSTEDYVNDPRFDIIMVGAKVGQAPAVWRTGTVSELAKWFDEIGLWDACVIAHNMMFDGLVLQKVFGRLPAKMLCTRFMANVHLKPYIPSVSLASCLEHTGLGEKGTTVKNMKGRTRDSLSRQEWKEYGAYCINDCESEYLLFKHMLPTIPVDELHIIDLTLRMYLEPRLLVDANVMSEELGAVIAKREMQLSALPASVTAADLASNVKFAKLLDSFGVEVPTKISPSTNKPTPALAKTDAGWKELEEQYSDDPVIGALIAARLGVKSTLEVTRYQRLLDIGLKYRWFRVPLMYYSAHTGRYGGTENINAQNFPRIDKSKMRFGIKAPKKHVVLAADLAQIEARITAWLAGEKALVRGFADKEDIYSAFATRVFKTETVKDRSAEDKRRRFVGKTCILGLGYGMGPSRLQATLRKDGMKFDLLQCTEMVNVYRDTYPHIPALWRRFDQALETVTRSNAQAKVGPVTLTKAGITLPTGLTLHYPQLRWKQYSVGEESKLSGYEGFVYTFSGREVRTLWGGKVTENVVQALARALIMKYMLEIWRELDLKPVLQQHDELNYVVPEAYADQYSKDIAEIMRRPAEWAEGLPIEVEVNYGPTLGHCK
jgi:DNA polymerase